MKKLLLILGLCCVGFELVAMEALVDLDEYTHRLARYFSQRQLEFKEEVMRIIDDTLVHYEEYIRPVDFYKQLQMFIERLNVSYDNLSFRYRLVLQNALDTRNNLSDAVKRLRPDLMLVPQQPPANIMQPDVHKAQSVANPLLSFADSKKLS